MLLASAGLCCTGGLVLVGGSARLKVGEPCLVHWSLGALAALLVPGGVPVWVAQPVGWKAGRAATSPPPLLTGAPGPPPFAELRARHKAETEAAAAEAAAEREAAAAAAASDVSKLQEVRCLLPGCPILLG